ncbi:MAG: flagellin FliC3 [Lachnospiraceae bacterium]|nr:flagellin FliC3 [Lachnospiraceae bacterium]
MKITYNISAMIANSALSRSDSDLSDSIGKLSSGYKINHAKDNASGLAMAKRMNAQIRSLEVAKQNANDGISVIEIAEGALVEVNEMIQRMNELSVKSANATMTLPEREMIEDEIDHLRDEIERIAETTMYNGQVLLDGTFDLRGYTTDNAIKVETYASEVRAGDYMIDSLDVTTDPVTGDITAVNVTLGANFPDGATVEYAKDSIFIKGANNFEMELRVKDNFTGPLKVTATGLGSLKMQIGSMEGQELHVRIPKISLRAMGIDKENYNVLNEENSQDFIAQISKALEYVNNARSQLGAYQNRLEHTDASLGVTTENMTAAYSRIMDVDMAEEMTEYTKNQVLVSAGTAMLAQANERPAQILQLLQG